MSIEISIKEANIVLYVVSSTQNVFQNQREKVEYSHYKWNVEIIIGVRLRTRSIKCHNSKISSCVKNGNSDSVGIAPHGCVWEGDCKVETKII